MRWMQSKNDILSKVGSQATVSFRVDPNILGGLVIRVGGKVLGCLCGRSAGVIAPIHLLITTISY